MRKGAEIDARDVIDEDRDQREPAPEIDGRVGEVETKPMRTARNQPAVEVMADSVGIRMRVRGMMPAIMARRVSSETPRSTGPTTKPMNRSMPVHSAPAMTCTKSRNQRLLPRIATTIAARATAAAAI